MAFEDANDVSLSAVVRINRDAAFVQLARLVTFTGERYLRSSVSAAGGAKAQHTLSVQGDGLHFSAEELPAVKVLTAVVHGEAPAELSLSDIDGFLQLCNSGLADKLMGGVGDYLLPVAQALPAAEVRPHIHTPMRPRLSCPLCKLSS